VLDIVTGGAGFIGSHLVDALLSKGRRVRVLDSFITGRRENLVHHANNASLEIIDGDVADKAICLAVCNGAERVFHLAARADIVPSIQEPEAYFRANVDAGRRDHRSAGQGRRLLRGHAGSLRRGLRGSGDADPVPGSGDRAPPPGAGSWGTYAGGAAGSGRAGGSG